jgi:hypothetical protein
MRTVIVHSGTDNPLYVAPRFWCHCEHPNFRAKKNKKEIVRRADPRNNGNWNHDEPPVPTYRQNCHPAMSLCQLARRGIIHKELDLNQRALSGDQLEGKSQTIHHARRGWQNAQEI